MHPDYVVRADPCPTAGDVQQVIDGLVDYNARHGPPGRFQRLASFVRDEQERVRGGAVGTLTWDWVFVSHLWIDEELRGRGLGTAVMKAFEELALAHGAGRIHLETLGFQARGFYERLGFRQFAELPNYAAGHPRHFMWKPLGADH